MYAEAPSGAKGSDVDQFLNDAGQSLEDDDADDAAVVGETRGSRSDKHREGRSATSRPWTAELSICYSATYNVPVLHILTHDSSEFSFDESECPLFNHRPEHKAR